MPRKSTNFLTDFENTIMTESNDLLTEKQTAEMLGVQTNTLRTWRVSKTQLPYIKISGNCIRYKRSVVEAWLVSKEVSVHQNLKPVAV